jgi:hypothetical protein
MVGSGFIGYAFRVMFLVFRMWFYLFTVSNKHLGVNAHPAGCAAMADIFWVAEKSRVKSGSGAFGGLRRQSTISNSPLPI